MSSYMPNKLRSSLSFGQAEFPGNMTWAWPHLCSEFRCKAPGGNIQLELEGHCVFDHWCMVGCGGGLLSVMHVMSHDA